MTLAIDKDLFRGIILGLCFISIALNLIYFVKSKQVWRWIKLVYAINNSLLAGYMITALAGYTLGILAQYAMLILLMLNITAGAVLSLYRIKYER